MQSEMNDCKPACTTVYLKKFSRPGVPVVFNRDRDGRPGCTLMNTLEFSNRIALYYEIIKEKRCLTLIRKHRYSKYLNYKILKFSESHL